MNLGQRPSKQMERKKKIVKIKQDRISSLPEKLIHHILSFLESRLAVQTIVLSKRWKFIWTTLPSPNLYNDLKFVNNFLSHRNNDSDVSKLNLSFGYVPPTKLINEFISYAMTHKVQVLNVDLFSPRATIKFSTFDSTFVQNLSLNLNFDRLFESDCWNLPALTTLHLIQYPKKPCKLPESYLICLPSLQTLFLDRFELPESISLPALRTLGLWSCTLPTEVWDLPALLTLQLDDVAFPEDTSEFFSALFKLRNFVLSFRTHVLGDWVINCPELENLTINVQMSTTTSHGGKVTVLSRKIHNFCSVLSSVSDYADPPPSPFYNLEYVKIPPGYKVSSMSTYLKCYLLGRSPKATIVSTFPEIIIPHIEPDPVTALNVVMEEILEAPSEVLVDSENMHKTVCIETMEEGLQEEQAVQNSKVYADRGRNVGALVAEKCNDLVSSSRRNGDFGLWRGYEVNAEYVCVLDQIMSKYPETFKHLTTKNNKFYKMKLNMLCTSVIEFSKVPLTEVDAEMIAEYMHVFADLQKLGFNVSWLVNRLNYIKQLCFPEQLPELHAIDCDIDGAKSKLQDLQIHIDDAKIKLQDLHTLRAEKMQELKKPSGTMSTKLAVGYAGYDLLSGP